MILHHQYVPKLGTFKTTITLYKHEMGLPSSLYYGTCRRTRRRGTLQVSVSGKFSYRNYLFRFVVHTYSHAIANTLTLSNFYKVTVEHYLVC